MYWKAVACFSQAKISLGYQSVLASVSFTEDEEGLYDFCDDNRKIIISNIKDVTSGV